MRARFLSLLAVSALAVTFRLCAAEEAVQAKVTVEEKQLQGEITAISANFLAVACGISSENGAGLESAFNFDKNTRIIHKSSIKQLGAGDTVSVSYRLIKETLPDGSVSQKKQVNSITFLKAAQKGLVSDEDATVSPKTGDAGTAVQGSSAASNPLALKGIKGEDSNE